MLKNILLVATGGALGSVGRFLSQHYFNKLVHLAFPYSTLLVNILGSFVIGLYHGYAVNNQPDMGWRYLIVIGFCGGFTTFSTFAHDNVLLLRNGHYSQFAVYILLSVFTCIAFVLLGDFAGRKI